MGNGRRVSDLEYEGLLAEYLQGQWLKAIDGHLYFSSGPNRHPVRVMKTTQHIRVGCVKLTHEAWEVLKRRIDGVGQ